MQLRLAAAPCCLLSLCLLIFPARAASDDTDPSLVIDRFIQHFVVAEDGSYRLTVEHAKTIAQSGALQEHGQYYISYNRSLDEPGAIEAYTRKPDGRRVAVLPEHIKDQQEAASADAPMFQDTRIKIIVFPEVEVGDQLVVRYALRRHTPLFPGHFEDLSTSQFYANRQFHLIYDMPASMPLQADAEGFAPVPIASPPGRRRYQWHYIDGPNPRIEAESVSYFDYGKRLAVSTFRSYADFAAAYAARAAPAARPTAAIRALARDITRGRAGPRARALALSDWVRRHIRYAGVYVGAGGVVPHPAATVLANRYGDCKDHAALLEALLAAAGIDSSAALVNNGNAYRLPATPSLGVLNHVITYVPSLNLYLDSTAESISAGYLPSGVMGKPVLFARTGKVGRTPSKQLERNRNFAFFGVETNGRSSFSIAKIAHGANAEPYRQAVRDATQAEREMFVQHMLKELGQTGSGVFRPGKLDGSGDEFGMRMEGHSDNFASLPGPVGLASAFNFWGGLGDAVFAFGQEKRRSQDFVCPPIDAEEETGFAFPDGVRILALPKSQVLRDAHFSYSARYLRRANTVTVRRRLLFRNGGMVCTAADYRRMQPLVERMIGDLRSQIIVTGQ